MDLIQILLILLILSSSALCIFTIYYLRKMSQKVEDVIRDFQDLIQKTNPVIENLEQISYRANRVVTEVEGYWNEIDGAIKNIRERISGLTSLRNLHDVEYPAKDLIKKIKAISKGASAFWNAFKHR